jgi:hypothetical protein
VRRDKKGGRRDQEGDGEDFEDLRGLKVVGDVDEAHVYHTTWMRRKEGQEGGKAGTGGGWRVAAGLRLLVSVSYYPRKEGQEERQEGRKGGG